MENPDPKRYREAEVALDLQAETFRGFLSRGTIAGRLRALLGGEQWDFRNPYLPRSEAERFGGDLARWSLDVHWRDDVLLVSDPEGRWRPVRLAPNRHSLYPVGAFGRPVRHGSGFLREWEEVVPLPRGGPLDAATIARALDTGLPLGPGFDRIEDEVEADTLIEALACAASDRARERIAILLAYHTDAGGAAAGLPILVGLLDNSDSAVRQSAATAIAEICSRAGVRHILAAAAGLAPELSARVGRERDEAVRDDLHAALGVIGGTPRGAPDTAAKRFAQEVQEALDFLRAEPGFEGPAVEDGKLSTQVTYRNVTTAVVAAADWRDGVAEVFLVKLERGALPVYADTEVTHWLAPSLLLQELEGGVLEPGLPDPRDGDATRRFLADEAEALKQCRDVLRGDFVRFDQALAGLRVDGR